ARHSESKRAEGAPRVCAESRPDSRKHRDLDRDSLLLVGRRVPLNARPLANFKRELARICLLVLIEPRRCAVCSLYLRIVAAEELKTCTELISARERSLFAVD